jgi:hypothetical protein
MSDYANENSWPMSVAMDSPECIVVNEDTHTVVSEFDSYLTAHVWIADTHDHQEDAGLELSNYSVYPVRVSPNGRDVR